MAGTGPPPKDAAQRRRRNEPARGEWTELPELGKPVLPTLPKPAPKGGWAARTRATWAQWRKDPATGMFGPSEIAAALDLAYIHHDWVRGDSKLAAEIRLRMDGLGLTPKGKRDLRWRAKPPGELHQIAEAPSAAPAAKRRLRAVDAGVAGG